MGGEGTRSKKRRQNGSGCPRDQHIWQQQVTHSEGMLSISAQRWDAPRWMHAVDHRGQKSQIFLLKSPSKGEAGGVRAAVLRGAHGWSWLPPALGSFLGCCPIN